ncbi:MAG: hypothetical protein ABSH53_24120 [Holophaga sp.]
MSSPTPSIHLGNSSDAAKAEGASPPATIGSKIKESLEAAIQHPLETLRGPLKGGWNTLAELAELIGKGGAENQAALHEYFVASVMEAMGQKDAAALAREAAEFEKSAARNLEVQKFELTPAELVGDIASAVLPVGGGVKAAKSARAATQAIHEAAAAKEVVKAAEFAKAAAASRALKATKSAEVEKSSSQALEAARAARAMEEDATKVLEAAKDLEVSKTREVARAIETAKGDIIRLETNPKHHPLSVSPQPGNVAELFGRSIEAENGTRWAMDSNGIVHRFSAPSNGATHWNGSTGGAKPIQVSSIPIDIKRKLNIKG